MSTRRALAVLGGIGVAAVLVLVATVHRGAPPPPHLGHVPAFHLVDQTGAAVTAASLRGQALIVDFIFTKCPDACPKLSVEMARLDHELASEKRARLVSISVDPVNDTPAVLARYAAGFGADPARWTFLTGDGPHVEETVVAGFKQDVSHEPKADGKSGFDLVHGTHLVLVDRSGDIRGYYSIEDEAGRSGLRRDLASVLDE